MRFKTLSIMAIIIVTGSVLGACAVPTPQVIEKVVTQEVEKQVIVTQEVKVEVEKERPQMQFWVDHPFYVKSTEGQLKSYVLECAQKMGADIQYSQDTDKVMWPRIDATIESKKLPDVLLLNLSWLPKMQKAGLPLDVTALVNELNGNLGGFTKGALASVTTADGKAIAVPFLASTEMMYVRQDLLDAKGLPIPDTWEDALKTAQAINNPPKIWGWGPQVAASSYDAERHRTAMIWAYGGSIMDKDGTTIKLDSPATREMLRIIKEAWDTNAVPKEILSWDDAANNKGYQSGQVAMIENTGSVANWLRDNDQELFNNTTFKAFPSGPAGRFIQGDVWVLFIPNTTAYPEQAQELVRCISQPKLAEELMTQMNGFRVPVYTDLTKLAMWENRALKPLADATPYTVMPGYPGPVTTVALETFKQNVIAKMVSRVLSDGWDADRAIAEAISTIERIQKDSQ